MSGDREEPDELEVSRSCRGRAISGGRYDWRACAGERKRGANSNM